MATGGAVAGFLGSLLNGQKAKEVIKNTVMGGFTGWTAGLVFTLTAVGSTTATLEGLGAVNIARYYIASFTAGASGTLVGDISFNISVALGFEREGSRTLTFSEISIHTLIGGSEGMLSFGMVRALNSTSTYTQAQLASWYARVKVVNTYGPSALQSGGRCYESAEIIRSQIPGSQMIEGDPGLSWNIDTTIPPGHAVIQAPKNFPPFAEPQSSGGIQMQGGRLLGPTDIQFLTTHGGRVSPSVVPPGILSQIQIGGSLSPSDAIVWYSIVNGSQSIQPSQCK